MPQNLSSRCYEHAGTTFQQPRMNLDLMIGVDLRYGIKTMNLAGGPEHGRELSQNAAVMVFRATVEHLAIFGILTNSF